MSRPTTWNRLTHHAYAGASRRHGGLAANPSILWDQCRQCVSRHDAAAGLRILFQGQAVRPGVSAFIWYMHFHCNMSILLELHTAGIKGSQHNSRH